MGRNISENMTVLKFFSILMVVLGHSDLLDFETWVPVTIGLLIFSYSSGYFTASKYSGDFDKKKYWFNKFQRLSVNLLVIQLFLLVLFLIQGRSGIFTWHTLVNVVGLTGFLNWFHINNMSPFGAGMWYFTLTLIFYLFYPWLRKLYRNKITATCFCFMYVVTTYALHKYLVYGHALWLTSCGFIMGLYFGIFRLELQKKTAGVALSGSFFLMGLLNYFFSYNQLNYFLILFFSVAFIQYFAAIRIAKILSMIVGAFSGCVLEIYLIHGYLYAKFTHNKLIDFILSLLIIILTAKILNLFSSLFLKWFFKIRSLSTV